MFNLPCHPRILPTRDLITRSRRLLTYLAALAVATSTLAGCGTQRRPRAVGLPSAAEPAAAPSPKRPPAGRSVPVGDLPEGITVAANSIVVAVRNPAQLVLLSPRTGRVLRRVSIAGAPRHLQLAGPDGPVLVPAEPINRLLELALPGGRISSIPVGPHPHDAGQDSGRVFVSNEFGDSVSVLSHGRVITQIGGFSQPAGIASLGGQVAIVDVRLNTVTLIDSITLRVVGHLPAGAGPTHVVAGGGGQFYVIDTRGDAVLSYATRPTFRRLARLALPGTPYGVAIDQVRHRLWVTLTGQDQLVELSTAGALPRVQHAYATERQPNTVAVDPRNGHVFVADTGPGDVQLITPVG